MKYSDKGKWLYIGYKIAFDGAGSKRFGNEFARKVVIFDVKNSSSSHANNRKTKAKKEIFLVSMEVLVHQRKSINFSKANSKFSLSLHYNGDIDYLFITEKEIYKFKANNKNVNLPTHICLESISNKFVASNSGEVSLKGNVDEYNSIDKSNILDIKNHLMVESNIK